MSARAAIKALLEADATLLTTATGGVWDYDETGRLGLSRTTTAAAFTAAGILKPCIVVKSRGTRPEGSLQDAGGRAISTREMIELWFYQDDGYDDIATMKTRAFNLLHEVQVSGTFRCKWAGSPFVQMRDEAMGNISVERDDYTVIALKTAS